MMWLLALRCSTYEKKQFVRVQWVRVYVYVLFSQVALTHSTKSPASLDCGSNFNFDIKLVEKSLAPTKRLGVVLGRKVSEETAIFTRRGPVHVLFTTTGN